MDPTNDLCELAKTRETTARCGGFVRAGRPSAPSLLRRERRPRPWNSVRGRASRGQLDRLHVITYRLAGRLVSRLHGGSAAIYSS
jgi:hypothetical protein